MLEVFFLIIGKCDANTVYRINLQTSLFNFILLKLLICVFQIHLKAI
jgi:hypothetical protein